MCSAANAEMSNKHNVMLYLDKELVENHPKQLKLQISNIKPSTHTYLDPNRGA
jgi:hypothetical protein